MKQTGMLVVSLRGANFGFWCRLGCSEHSTNILSYQETQNYAKRNRSQFFFLTCFVFVFVSFLAVSFRGQNLLKPWPDWSPLRVPNGRWSPWSPLGAQFKISDEHPCLFHMGVPLGFNYGNYSEAM